MKQVKKDLAGYKIKERFRTSIDYLKDQQEN